MFDKNNIYCLEMQTILATGGCGFIGSHTCVEFLLNGYRVIILDSLINSSEDTINKIKEVVSLTDPKITENLEFVNSDIRDTEYLSIYFYLKKKITKLLMVLFISQA